MNHPVSRILTVFLLTGLLGQGSLALRAAENAIAYLSVMEDLPLAPGLKEVPGSALVFDSAQGRIVEGYADGAVDRAKVYAFYGATLAQLGWTELEPGRFRRESEELTIEFTEPANGGPGEFTEPANGGPGLTVRFALSPAKSGRQ